MSIFFTSDEHYYHENIIKFAKRPFSGLPEMHEALIAGHNEVVKSNDEVYHLGDIAFCDVAHLREIVRRLNGKHHLIYGNHDAKRLLGVRPALYGFETARAFHEIRVPDETVTKGRCKGTQPIVLLHYAMRVWNKSHYGAWQLYGHSHGTLKDDPHALQLDVGVDCWDYKPVSYERVREEMKKKLFIPVDQHGAD